MTENTAKTPSDRRGPSIELVAITCSVIVIVVFCLAALVMAVLFLGIGPII